jgi:hypothetical protein
MQNEERSRQQAAGSGQQKRALFAFSSFCILHFAFCIYLV